MNVNEFAIILGGILTAIVGIGHCFFYRFFGWAKDFRKISELNAKIFYTINVFLIPLLLFFAYVSLAHTNELVNGTQLGSSVTVFFSLFWLMRGLWQVTYLSPSGIDGVKKLIPLHYALTAMFFLQFVLYAIPTVNNLI